MGMLTCVFMLTTGKKIKWIKDVMLISFLWSRIFLCKIKVNKNVNRNHKLN